MTSELSVKVLLYSNTLPAMSSMPYGLRLAGKVAIAPYNKVAALNKSKPRTSQLFLLTCMDLPIAAVVTSMTLKP